MNPHEIACFFELFKKVINGLSVGETLHLVGVGAHRVEEEFISYLCIATIKQPRITRHDPGNSIGINTIAQ